MRRGLVTTLLICAACVVPEYGHGAMLPPVGKYPDAVCDYDASGDIYVGPDGHFWECICERRVFIEDDCAWYDQGAVNSARNAKLRRRILVSLHVRVIPRGRVLVVVA